MSQSDSDIKRRITLAEVDMELGHAGGLSERVRHDGNRRNACRAGLSRKGPHDPEGTHGSGDLALRPPRHQQTRRGRSSTTNLSLPIR